MRFCPPITLIRPKAASMKKRLTKNKTKDKEAHSSERAEVKLPSITPDSSIKYLQKPYPISKISLVASKDERGKLWLSNLNSGVMPKRLYHNGSSYSILQNKSKKPIGFKKSISPLLIKDTNISISGASGTSFIIQSKSLTDISI